MPANLSQLPLFVPPDGDPPIPHAGPAKPHIALPFQRSEEIDTARAAKILGVSKSAMHQMLREGLIRAYRLTGSGRGESWRIEYQSVVEYCDRLRVANGISARRAGNAPMRGRRRDADLLPFPMDETVSVAEVAQRLDCARNTVIKLIQSGSLTAYQVLIHEAGCPWRIHAPSVDRYILGLRRMAASRCPGASSRPG